MSDPHKDRATEWIIDNQMDLVEEYLEEQSNALEFVDWLYHKHNRELRYSLYERFLADREVKEVKRYRIWAWDRAIEYTRGEE